MLEAELNTLISLCKHFNIKGAFHAANRDYLMRVASGKRFSSELVEYFRIAEPVGVSIEWSIEFLRLYSLKQAVEGIAVYTEHFTPQGKSASNWKENMIPIGDYSSNPIFADVLEFKTPVYMQWHDSRWRPQLVAPSLQTFFRVISTWIEVYYGAFNKQIDDKEYALRSDVKASLLGQFREVVGEACTNNLLEFIE